MSSREVLERAARPRRAPRRARQRRRDDRRRAGLRRRRQGRRGGGQGLGHRPAPRRADDDQGLVADGGHADDVGGARAGRPSCRPRTRGRSPASARPAPSMFGKTNLPALRRRLPELQRGLRHHEQPLRRHPDARVAPRAGRPPRWPAGSRRSSSAATSVARSACPSHMSRRDGAQAELRHRARARPDPRPARHALPRRPGRRPGPWPARSRTWSWPWGCWPVRTAGTRPAWRLELPAGSPPRPRRLPDRGLARRRARARSSPRSAACCGGPSPASTAGGAVVDSDARPGFTLPRRPTRSSRSSTPRCRAATRATSIERFAADTDDSALGQTHRYTAMRHREWLSLHERRLQLRLRWEQFFTSWDAILLPVMPMPGLPARPQRADGRPHDPHRRPDAPTGTPPCGWPPPVPATCPPPWCRWARPRPGCRSASRSSGRTCTTGRRCTWPLSWPSASEAAPRRPGF